MSRTRIKTSLSLTEAEHDRLSRLTDRHLGKMTREVAWLIGLGEVYLDLAPGESEILDMIIKERMDSK